MTVFFHDRFTADLQEHEAFLAERGGDSLADRFNAAVQATINLLVHYPELGRSRTDLPRRFHHLRSSGVVGFRNWLIFYAAREDSLDFVRCLHGRADLRTRLK